MVGSTCAAGEGVTLEVEIPELIMPSVDLPAPVRPFGLDLMSLVVTLLQTISVDADESKGL